VLNLVHEWDGLLDPNGYEQLKKLWARMAPHLGEVWPDSGKLPADDPEASARMMLRGPPFLSQGLGTTAKALTSVVAGVGAQKTVEEMGAAVRQHPEGTLYFLYACLLFANKRYEEADAAFLKAMETPALGSVRRPALHGAILCEGFLASPKRGDPNPAM